MADENKHASTQFGWCHQPVVTRFLLQTVSLNILKFSINFSISTQCTRFLSERTSVPTDVVPSHPWAQMCLACPLRMDETNKAINIKSPFSVRCIPHDCTGMAIQTILTLYSPNVEGPPEFCRGRGNLLSLQKDTALP